MGFGVIDDTQVEDLGGGGGGERVCGLLLLLGLGLAAARWVGDFGKDVPRLERKRFVAMKSRTSKQNSAMVKFRPT